MPTPCEIITIGDEILIGQIIDTNSAWLGQQLNELGMEIIQITSVQDNPEAISKAIDAALGRAELVLTTGGLGPTKDDITKKTLAEHFGVPMTRRPEVVANLEHIFRLRDRKMTELNISQADIPANAAVLHNAKGTAPGMLFEVGDRWLVSMPGVPYEMKVIFEESLKPLLATHFKAGSILHRTLQTVGVAESVLAVQIEAFESSLPSSIKLAYLPSPGIVRLRLTARADGEGVEDLKGELDEALEALKIAAGSCVFAEGDVTLQQNVLSTIQGEKKTFALAESCSGGYIAHLITSIPGSSSAFMGSSVTYSYESKTLLLEVSEETLKTQGAVSEATVIEMAQGALRTFKVDYALAVSGVAGPSGGTADKPVGTVWAAVASSEGAIRTELFHFGPNRDVNIKLTAVHGLNLLRKFILTLNSSPLVAA